MSAQPIIFTLELGVDYLAANSNQITLTIPSLTPDLSTATALLFIDPKADSDTGLVTHPGFTTAYSSADMTNQYVELSISGVNLLDNYVPGVYDFSLIPTIGGYNDPSVLSGSFQITS